MAKTNDYKSRLSQLSEKINSEPPTTPIQEVRPVEQSNSKIPSVAEPANKSRKETHVNFWVPEELMERLKIHAARSRKTIKQIGIEALEAFLPKS